MWPHHDERNKHNFIEGRQQRHCPGRGAGAISVSSTILGCTDWGDDQVTEAQRRIKSVRAIRRSSELEGSRNTDATRADQVAYARGSITAAELAERVRRRYNVQ